MKRNWSMYGKRLMIEYAMCGRRRKSKVAQTWKVFAGSWCGVKPIKPLCFDFVVM